MIHTHLKAVPKGESGYDSLLDSSIIKRVMFMLVVINNYARKQIIRLLKSYLYLSVTEIYCKTRLSQSEASTHLSLLRKIGLVKTRRDGKYVMYSLDADRAALIRNELALLGMEDNKEGLHSVRHHHVHSHMSR